MKELFFINTFPKTEKARVDLSFSIFLGNIHAMMLYNVSQYTILTPFVDFIATFLTCGALITWNTKHGNLFLMYNFPYRCIPEVSVVSTIALMSICALYLVWMWKN